MSQVNLMKKNRFKQSANIILSPDDFAECLSFAEKKIQMHNNDVLLSDIIRKKFCTKYGFLNTDMKRITYDPRHQDLHHFRWITYKGSEKLEVRFMCVHNTCFAAGVMMEDFTPWKNVTFQILKKDICVICGE